MNSNNQQLSQKLPSHVHLVDSSDEEQMRSYQNAITNNNKNKTSSGPSTNNNNNNNDPSHYYDKPVPKDPIYETYNNRHQYQHRKYRAGIRSAPGSDNGRSQMSTATSMTAELFSLCGKGLIRRIKKSSGNVKPIQLKMTKGVGDYFMNQFGDTEHFDAEEYLSTDSEDDSGVGGWNLAF